MHYTRASHAAGEKESGEETEDTPSLEDLKNQGEQSFWLVEFEYATYTHNTQHTQHNTTRTLVFSCLCRGFEQSGKVWVRAASFLARFQGVFRRGALLIVLAINLCLLYYEGQPQEQLSSWTEHAVHWLLPVLMALHTLLSVLLLGTFVTLKVLSRGSTPAVERERERETERDRERQREQERESEKREKRREKREEVPVC